MHIVTKTCALLIGTISLTACDGPIEPFAFDTTYTTYADISTAFQADVDANVEPNGLLIDPLSISESTDFDSVDGGSAIYNGAIIADETGGGERLIGQLQLEADFDVDRIDGRAGNFIRSDGAEFGGLLLGSTTFTRDAAADADGNNFAMDLTGILDNEGTLVQGNFLSSGGDVSDIAGDADITMTGEPDFDGGAFWAER